MTLQAQVRIAFDQHLPIDRTVRGVADGAAFPHGFMLENKWSRLFAVAGRTALVEAGHCQTAGWFEDIAAVRVVALRAVHPVLDDGMVMREIEFSVRFEMALKTGGGV